MLALGVPNEVIQFVSGHKNPKSLSRYDRTAIMRHIVAQSVSRGEGGPDGYSSQFVDREMEYWRRRNLATTVPLAPHSRPIEIEGSLYSFLFNFSCQSQSSSTCLPSL